MTVEWTTVLPRKQGALYWWWDGNFIDIVEISGGNEYAGVWDNDPDGWNEQKWYPIEDFSRKHNVLKWAEQVKPEHPAS